MPKAGAGRLAVNQEARAVRTRVRSFACLIVVTTILASACGGPTILSYHGSWWASAGKRQNPHIGVDFGGAFGAPVLAAADGTVERAGTIGPRCGVGVSIKHEFGLHTVYCHLSTVQVLRGATIKRGQTIGTIGMTGDSGFVPHLHFMVGSNGEYDHDPLNYIVGCYESGVEYPTDKVVLTYPVECRNR